MRFLLILFFLFITSLSANGFPKWYYKISNPKEKKIRFIEILLPMIEKENAKILEERRFVQSFFAKDFLVNFNLRINNESLSKLVEIANKYKIDNIYNKDEYLLKIDKIPPSLALAQGALESAWGNSRFVKLGNNIFGQWTWSEGNGIVPSNREEGKKHMIKIFSTLDESVSSYMLNLNRNFSYEEFRQKRKSSKYFNGLDACKTMLRYSQLGDVYVDRLILMIEKNNLLILDY